jgi:hypothetical protein
MENKKRRIAEIKEDLADPNTPATLKKMLKEELAELEGSKKPSSKKSPEQTHEVGDFGLIADTNKKFGGREVKIEKVEKDSYWVKLQFSTPTDYGSGLRIPKSEFIFVETAKDRKYRFMVITFKEIAETKERSSHDDFRMAEAIKKWTRFIADNPEYKKRESYPAVARQIEKEYGVKKNKGKKEVDPEIKAEAKRIFQEYLDKGGYEKIAKENALPLFPQLEKGIKPEKVVMEHFEKHLDCLDYDKDYDLCESWEDYFEPKEQKELMKIWRAEIKKLVVPKSKKKAPAKKRSIKRPSFAFWKQGIKAPTEKENLRVKTDHLEKRYEILKSGKVREWRVLEEYKKGKTDMVYAVEANKELFVDSFGTERPARFEFHELTGMNFGKSLLLTEAQYKKWLEDQKKPKKTSLSSKVKAVEDKLKTTKKKKPAKKAPAKKAPAKKSAGAKKKATVKKKVEKSKLTPEEKKKVAEIKKLPKYKRLLKGVSDEEILADMKRKAKKAGKRPQKKGSKHKFYYEHRRTKTDEDLRRKI